MSSPNVRIRHLGQSGFRFDLANVVVYVDPYLSDSVAETEGASFRRLYPPPLQPSEVRDADFVCITHRHGDHCDGSTIVPLSHSSPSSRFLGPREVVEHLRLGLGIASHRLVVAPETWLPLGKLVQVRAIAASHPSIERDREGFPACVGFLFDVDGRLFYHSGDTSPNAEMIETLRSIGPIDVAFLPVNERNYYRDRNGIVGNMSIREAFGLATDIGAKIVVPMHYDMFEQNTTFPGEIRAVYEGIRPTFRLAFDLTDA